MWPKAGDRLRLKDYKRKTHVQTEWAKYKTAQAESLGLRT